MDYTQMFNDSLLDFINDLAPIMGNLPEYNLVCSGVKWLNRFEPSRNQAIFHRHVAVPYAARITVKDETFFLESEEFDARIGGEEKNYFSSGARSSGSSSHDNSNDGILQLLRNVWKLQLSEADKLAIWSHLHVLIALDRKCQQQKTSAASLA